MRSGGIQYFIPKQLQISLRYSRNSGLHLKSCRSFLRCSIWDKGFKNGPSKICGRHSKKFEGIWSAADQIFKFLKGCLPQLLLGPLLNTLSHMFLKRQQKHSCNMHMVACFAINIKQVRHVISKLSFKPRYFATHVVFRIAKVENRVREGYLIFFKYLLNIIRLLHLQCQKFEIYNVGLLSASLFLRNGSSVWRTPFYLHCSCIHQRLQKNTWSVIPL